VRRRLLTLVFTTTAFALTLLGIVWVLVIWAFMGSAAHDRAGETARVAAAALHDSVEAHGQITERTLVRYVRDQAYLRAQLPDGRTLASGPAPTGDTYSASAVAGNVRVVAEIPMSVNLDMLRFQAGVVVALSLFVLGVAMLVALFYARRITRPLEDFAELAGRVATGDRRQLDRRYGVPELDAVADVLDLAVSNFNTLLESERRVTSDASHQLRTPLTALSLRLEEILATDDIDVVRTEATAALGQVERLAGVVDEVVGVSRGLRLSPSVPFAIDDLVASQLVEWTPAFDAAGRRLRRQGVTGLVVDAGRGAQAQVLATLIENSLVHGRGTTSVRVRRSGSWVELGNRVFERSVSGGDSTGLGLSLARTLVMADGGRLEMISARPAVFAMFLPACTGDRAGSDHSLDGSAAGGRSVAGPAAVRSAADPVRAPLADAEGAQVMVEMVASAAASESSGNTQRR
jgi:signal transduction histidine kinase